MPNSSTNKFRKRTPRAHLLQSTHSTHPRRCPTNKLIAPIKTSQSQWISIPQTSVGRWRNNNYLIKPKASVNCQVRSLRQTPDFKRCFGRRGKNTVDSWSHNYPLPILKIITLWTRLPWLKVPTHLRIPLEDSQFNTISIESQSPLHWLTL
jgi:hypothetical protein